MTDSRQLEREAQACREQVSRTLDELRARLAPGELIEQLVQYGRVGAPAEMARNLGRQAVGNPLPLALVGTGLAWLMMADRDGQPNGSLSHLRHRPDPVAERMSEASEPVWADEDEGRPAGLAGAGLGLANGAADAAARAGSAAGMAARAAGSRTASAAGAVSDAGRRTAAMSGDIVSFLKEQPLVLAGLGLAVGAALGAFLPATETEDRLIGDVGEELKERAREAVDKVSETGGTVAERVGAAARETVIEEAGAAHEDGQQRTEQRSGDEMADVRRPPPPNGPGTTR